jgi:hypothetical protein
MLPNPEIQPLLRPAEIVGLHPSLRRTAVYDAIKRGDLPSIVIGSRIFIPTAALRRMLGLDDPGCNEGLGVAPEAADRARAALGAIRSAEDRVSAGANRGVASSASSDQSVAECTSDADNASQISSSMDLDKMDLVLTREPSFQCPPADSAPSPRKTRSPGPPTRIVKDRRTATAGHR